MAYETPKTYEGSTQLVDFYYMKKALIDMKDEMFFSQLADTMSMPKHYGKTIKRYHYIPLLDDRNINDQGIDATGSSVANEVTITITDPNGYSKYAVGTGDNDTNALADAKKKAEDLLKNLGMTVASYDAIKGTLEGAGWTITEGEAVNGGGNLYGSSRDVGTIVGKLPTISETGGRVNRVGFTRVELEATMQNFGFFDEYTEDSMNFDTDADLYTHISREALRGANKIVEDCLQIDLLNGANVVFYGGDATSVDTITGEKGATPSTLDYATLIKVETILNDNKCPKDTRIITGSRMIDTKVIGACRYAYVGSELKTTLLSMKDFHDKPAFIPVQHYASAGTIATGEIGSIANFRFIENPNMMHCAGAGAAVTDNDGYMESNGHYNVYPVLIIGSNSFATIGFQTAGGTSTAGGETPVKFKIIAKKPGVSTAGREDPYGKIGFYSIQWWYGFIAWRPEWIACIKVVAKR